IDQEKIKKVDISDVDVARDVRSYTVVPDREKAIEAAIGIASSGDIVFIAGKGHEDYQIIGTKKMPFDDRKIAAHALQMKG
ncbi:MAG: UDP-N-acetylmuramoyl-L-alanyl-D-glutamate--2,6-diaminopimelate ligase, partial [Smithella sp.]